MLLELLVSKPVALDELHAVAQDGGREGAPMKRDVQPQVISASRRTDIPNHYASWFLQRLSEGFVLVRNVRDPHRVRRVDLSVDAVACIVFWTKNPAPLMEYLPALAPYPYYLHYTITGYGTEMEPRIPPFSESIDRFRRLSDIIGPERIIWRYDPIIITNTYPESYHMDLFGHMASRLKGYTERCVFSFVDQYRHLERQFDALGILPIETESVNRLASNIAHVSTESGMRAVTCAEPYDLVEYGVEAGACIDASLIERLSGYAISERKDRNQRPHCRCAPSIDIGMYNTCLNLCSYCYANNDERLVHAHYAKARSTSKLISGDLEPNDRVEEEPVGTKAPQLSLFGET